MIYDAHTPETLAGKKRARIQGRINRYRENLRDFPEHECADLWLRFIKADELKLSTLATSQS